MSSAGIFLAPISRTWYLLIPTLSMNLPDHICQFTPSPLKRILQIVFSSIFVLSCIYCHISPQGFVLLVVLLSMLVVSNNLSDLSALYTLKGFLICFNLCLFTYYDSVIPPSKILPSLVFLIMILSFSFL